MPIVSLNFTRDEGACQPYFSAKMTRWQRLMPTVFKLGKKWLAIATEASDVDRIGKITPRKAGRLPDEPHALDIC